MQSTELINHLNATLLLVLYLSAPVLAVAAGVGLVVGLLQAVTQIQDQSLPQTLKLIAVLVTIALLGRMLAMPLVNEARELLDQFPALSR
jgi:type III secretion protein S